MSVTRRWEAEHGDSGNSQGTVTRPPTVRRTRGGGVFLKGRVEVSILLWGLGVFEVLWRPCATRGSSTPPLSPPPPPSSPPQRQFNIVAAPLPKSSSPRLVFGVRLVAVISSRGLDEFPSPLDAISAASLVALSLIVFGHSLRTLSPLVVALISSTSVVTTSSPGVYSASFRCPFKLSDLSVIIRYYSSTQPRLHLLAPDPHARARPSCWVYLGRRGRINSRTGAFRPYHSVH
ncbi:hypothetical protein B0H13DRAFT_2662662 [Mycena leptocephala]|nr:hypothetical protein B0H13DRAFT_2662662 [Mycena leptocephala]